MALTLSELITEVQALTGREDDAELITQARVVRFLNMAQDEIVKTCFGHIDLETKDADAITLATETYSYSFASLTPEVFHLLDVFYMDGSMSKKLHYRDTEDFDEDHPDPTLFSGIPTEWTRRGATIEIYPIPSESEDGKYLRVDYTKVPTAFSTSSLTATCNMAMADQGLVYFAVSEAFKSIGGHPQESADYRNDFYTWLEEYRRLKDGRYLSMLSNLFA